MALCLFWAEDDDGRTTRWVSALQANFALLDHINLKRRKKLMLNIYMIMYVDGGVERSHSWVGPTASYTYYIVYNINMLAWHFVINA